MILKEISRGANAEQCYSSVTCHRELHQHDERQLIFLLSVKLSISEKKHFYTLEQIGVDILAYSA